MTDELSSRQNTSVQILFSNILATASGLSFLILLMCLPLVGRAGHDVPYSEKNYWTFLVVLILTLVLAGGATALKYDLWQKRETGTPVLSLGVCGICLLLLLCFFSGLLHV